MKKILKKYSKFHLITAIIFVALFSVLSYESYLFWKLNKHSINLENQNKTLESNLKETTGNLASTTQALLAQIEINNSFSSQIQSIVSTVGNLDKLSKTDKELLQKYSKVYFLNENYVPESLIDIDKDFAYEPGKKLQIHTKVLPKLEQLVEDASRAGINLKIVSAHRSFGEQSTLKSSYRVTYGSGANRFSADQGFSEHQLGTAIDFTTVEIKGSLDGFDKTTAYKWLIDNAFKYGFILSYPKNNSYYLFEPWHWRFVGKNLALKLHEENKYFYDLEQRNIDQYLISIFD